MFCPKCGCVPSTHTASPPSSPSAHFILVCGAQLIPGFRIILPVPAARGDRDISACKEWGRDLPTPFQPFNVPPAPTPPSPVLEAFPNWTHPILPRMGAVGWGPWREQLVSPPPSSVPPIRWCWPRAEFSIWEDVCVCLGGWRRGCAANTGAV